MDFCILGQKSSSSYETRSSNMVSLRKQRLRSPSPPPSDDTDPCIPELEPIQGRNMIPDFSDTRSDQSLEQSSPDHEAEENNAHQSEDQASSVPETVRRTPLDQVEPRLMSMSSILARSRPAEPVWLHPDLNQKPGEEGLPSTELQLGLGRGHTIPTLPAVKFRRAGEDEVSEDTGEDSAESMGSEDEKEDHEVPEIMSSGESSDCSLETRYLKSWRQTPSVSSRRRGRVAFKRGNSIVLPECRSIGGEINTSRNQRMKNYTRERPLSRAGRNDNDVEVAAPGPSGHYLRSSTANDDLDEGEDEPPEEGSVMHSVYSLVMVCGQEGICKEDVLVSLHGQSRPAMLAHTDWEADVKLCLKSRFFVQVHGQYILRKFYCPNRPSSSKGKERESLSSGETGLQGRRKVNGKSVQGSLSMGNIKDHGVGGRGSLRAKQKRIEEENGTQEGVRRCALMASIHRKIPWQCPLMAMKDHKLCEHHFERRELVKMKAKAMRKRTNFGQGEFFGGSATV